MARRILLMAALAGSALPFSLPETHLRNRPSQALRARSLVPSPPVTFYSDADSEGTATPYDLAVLGAGPVGVQAALQAAGLGKRVILIDAPDFSGALVGAENEDLSLGGPTGLFSKARPAPCALPSAPAQAQMPAALRSHTLARCRPPLNARGS